MSQPQRPAATGAARVREGYLSNEERRALAELLDTIEHCLDDIEPVPAMISNAWLHVHLALSQPRGVPR